MSGGGSTSYTSGYRYKFGIHMGICRGPVDEIVEIRVGDRTAWTGSVSANSLVPIDAPELFGGESGEGGVQGDLHVLMGGPTQVAPDLLVSMMAAIDATGDGSTPVPNIIDGGAINSNMQGGPVWLSLRTDGTARASIAGSEFNLPDQWLKNAPVNPLAAALYEVRITATAFADSSVSGADGNWHDMNQERTVELLDASGGPLIYGTVYSADVFITIRLKGDPTIASTGRIYMAASYANDGGFSGGEGGGGEGGNGDSGDGGAGVGGGDAAGDGSASA